MEINEYLKFDQYFLSNDCKNNEYILCIINILKEIISETPEYNLLRKALYEYKTYNNPWYFFGYNTKHYTSFINNCKYFLDNILRFSKACNNLKFFFNDQYYVYGYNGTYFCAKENEVQLKPFCKLSDIKRDLVVKIEKIIDIFKDY